MRIRFSLVSAGVVCTMALLNLSGAEPLPQMPKKPVTDEYQGVKLEDNYQWLEQDDDPAVKAWSDAQSRRTREYLDKLPDRTAIEKQLTDWYAKTSPTYSGIVSRPGILFARKFQPPKQQQILVTLASADALNSEKVVLDPNKLDPSGKTAIDWFVPSRDGKYVAMSISQGGSEDGTLHIYETATGKALKDSIAHVQYPTAGGSAAWNADGTGIYYTRFPRKGDRPDADLNFYQQVYFHKIGTADSEDTYSIGKDFPRIAEIKLEASHDGKYILATVANGDGGDFAHYLLGPDGDWKQLTQFSDQIKAARIGRDGALYLLSRADAPRGKILRMPLDKPELANATVIVPPSDAVIQFMEPTADAIYVGDLLGGPSQIRRFGLDGKGETIVPIPNISAVTEMESLEDDSLLDRGGVWVVANIRGGGEFGEEWHKAGNLTKKQNVFDDFAAAAQYLINEKWTRPERLAILGGSNGGLLMGAMFTQHPDLVRAVVSAVGIYDMLRVELAPNGAFNVTEFGTVKDPEQFKALYGYSPYHHVADGTNYPAILFMTGANDGRVAPYHSRKIVARIDEANKSGNPILLRTSTSSGHGIGTALSERIKQLADQYSFLFAQLEMRPH